MKVDNTDPENNSNQGIQENNQGLVSKQKGYFLPMLAAIVIILVIGIGGYFLYQKQGIKPVVTLPQQVSQPTPSPIIDETVNWKTYTDGNNKFSFKYPGDWLLSTSDYLNSKTLTNKNNSVSVTFSDKQYPFGFGPDDKPYDTNDLKIFISGREYKVKEAINDTSAFVNFKTDQPNVIYVLFGTGYPGGFGGVESIADYNNSKETILKILSTFKFIN